MDEWRQIGIYLLVSLVIVAIFVPAASAISIKLPKTVSAGDTVDFDVRGRVHSGQEFIIRIGDGKFEDIDEEFKFEIENFQLPIIEDIQTEVCAEKVASLRMEYLKDGSGGFKEKNPGGNNEIELSASCECRGGKYDMIKVSGETENDEIDLELTITGTIAEDLRKPDIGFKISDVEEGTFKIRGYIDETRCIDQKIIVVSDEKGGSTQSLLFLGYSITSVIS
jgi:hypothetical protein